MTNRILYEADGELVDEIVVDGVDLHIEVMSDECIWLSITRGKQQLSVNLGKRTRCGAVVYDVEDVGDEPWRWESEERHPTVDEPPKLIDVSVGKEASP